LKALLVSGVILDLFDSKLAAIGAAFVLIDLGCLLFSKERRALHDRLAKTWVVKDTADVATVPVVESG
jgi:uncharacterized RDD family membrane protein YckC